MLWLGLFGDDGVGSVNLLPSIARSVLNETAVNVFVQEVRATCFTASHDGPLDERLVGVLIARRVFFFPASLMSPYRAGGYSRVVQQGVFFAGTQLVSVSSTLPPNVILFKIEWR